MESARRDQILRAYVGHVRRFDGIAAHPFHTSGWFPGTEAAAARQREQSAAQRESGSLSVREQDVLSLVADGLSNQEIGSKLGITVETVKAHVRRILQCLDTRNRAHAVHLGFERGLLDSGPSVRVGQ
jgi:DNA-binding NarL/FixJ family response regulator